MNKSEFAVMALGLVLTAGYFITVLYKERNDVTVPTGVRTLCAIFCVVIPIALLLVSLAS